MRFTKVKTLFEQSRLFASVTLEDPESALPIATALMEGGLSVMEVTFRTSSAAEAIRSISRRVPGITVGAGTLLTPTQVEEAADAGAAFGLAPGYNPTVIEQAKCLGFPFIPGVSTPSEIERAIGEGHRLLKLFPADHLGGPGYIRSLAGPYGHTGVRFLPMSGIGPSNLQEYSRLKIVAAMGGSWLVPPEARRTGDPASIAPVVRRSLEELLPAGE